MNVWSNIKVLYTGINFLIGLGVFCLPSPGCSQVQPAIHSQHITQYTTKMSAYTIWASLHQTTKKCQDWGKKEIFAIITEWLLVMFFTGVTWAHEKSRLLAKGLWTRKHCLRTFSSYGLLSVLSVVGINDFDKWIFRVPLGGARDRIKLLQFTFYIDDVQTLNKSHYHSTTIILLG